MKENTLKIIKNYGINHQLKHLYTEIYEFTEAVLEYEHSEIGNKDHILEEYADLMVMLEQFKNYYELDNKKIIDMMTFKIERQLKRIENEKSN